MINATTIIFEGNAYECRESETVLDALLRQGVTRPFSCRNGICHVCMMRSVAGEVGERARAGIEPSLQSLGYFLPCRCLPQEDLEIAPPRADDLYFTAMVAGKEMLGSSVCRLLLEPSIAFDYRAGQFINLRRSDGLTRSYSLASVPEVDNFLELHVARRHNGLLSNWIVDDLQEGDEIELQGPSGDNVYSPADPGQPMLLIATGAGLAPLWGVLNDALHNGHTGALHVYHGSRHRENLYLHDQLRALDAEHPNLHYHPCLSGSEVSPGIRRSRADAAAVTDHRTLHDWVVHIAGVPAMVYATRDAVTDLGARASNVRADPFELTDRRRTQEGRAGIAYGRRADDEPSPEISARPWLKPEAAFPPPDPDLWAALGEGALMGRILRTFYDRVYADPALSPYFGNVTKQRLIEKQYSFLKRIFTGEPCYFGERPRNAHHWMVISNELFDHRLRLLRESAREHGLSEHWIRRWDAVEEAFRGDVVKSTSWPRVIDGVEVSLDGLGEMRLDVGALCDGCGRAVEPGETVRYHLRTGETYCVECATL